jgi:hypothetical protein
LIDDVSCSTSDVPVPEVVLDRARVAAIVRELVAGGMPKHVRMDGKGEASQETGASHQLADGRRRHGPTELGDEQIRRSRVLPLQLQQRRAAPGLCWLLT